MMNFRLREVPERATCNLRIPPVFASVVRNSKNGSFRCDTRPSLHALQGSDFSAGCRALIKGMPICQQAICAQQKMRRLLWTGYSGREYCITHSILSPCSIKDLTNPELDVAIFNVIYHVRDLWYWPEAADALSVPRPASNEVRSATLSRRTSSARIGKFVFVEPH